VSGSCECGNGHLGSIKCGEFLGLALEVLASQEGLCTVELLGRWVGGGWVSRWVVSNLLFINLMP
jgi:hypothetical protein